MAITQSNHQTKGPDTAGAGKLASIPFVLHLNLIYLKISVNGSEPCWFILDTGAQVTIIDSEAAQRSALKYENLSGQASGAGAETLSVAVASSVSLSLSGFKTSFDQLYVVPIGQIVSPFAGRATHGMLGYDFISRYVIEIDYAERRIHLYDPQTYQYTGKGEVFSLSIANNHPLIRVELRMPGGKTAEANLIFDTGAAPSLLLLTSFVEEQGLMASGGDKIPDLTGGAGGLSPAVAGRIEELRFGKVAVKNLVAQFSQSKEDVLAQFPETDGVLGAEILRRYTVIWDYSRSRMILEPNRFQNDPYDTAVAGLLLKAESPDYKLLRVAGVADGSPAAAAGLRAEDRILKIDGKATERLTLKVVAKMFAQPKTYQLLVQRGRARLKLMLTPRSPQ
ncbi:MAG: aspartyl protease family protein [Acidobacteria bacterium]|nr:aspartyl protease family protein [Acidobacteriota bacterium]